MTLSTGAREPRAEPTSVTLIGRSSSVFTRVARIFAAELDVAYSLRVVPDLLSPEPGDYGGNPALRLPVLETSQGAWFGALSICRQLRRLSTLPGAKLPAAILWPEALEQPLLANAQELTLQAMATEVTLIMNQLAGAGESVHQRKLEQSLLGSLGWLDRNIARVREELPPLGSVSYLEVTLFSLVTHL